VGSFAIGVMTWDRPSTFSKCLATIAANDLTDVDVHVWQEGINCRVTGEPRTDQCTIDDNRTIFEREQMPHKEWHVQPQHMGCAMQRLTMSDYLSDHYDSFLITEDDVVVSSHLVPVVKNILAQFGNDPRVGTINPGQKLLCGTVEVSSNWDAVTLNDGRTTRMCIDAMTSAIWNQLSPNYTEYTRIISGVPYHHIGDGNVRRAVANWAASLGSDILEVSCDTALLRAVLLAGKQRMFAVVNRATNIGDWGLNCTPSVLAQLGDGHQPIYECDEEINITSFRIVEGQ